MFGLKRREQLDNSKIFLPKLVVGSSKRLRHGGRKGWASWSSSSVQFSCSVVYDSLQPHTLQYGDFPVHHHQPYSDSCPSCQWCHSTISSSVIPFSHLQSFPASGSFPMSQFFASGGQSTGASASTSFLSVNNQDWFSLGLTGWISLQSKGLLRVFSNTTVQKDQFLGAQLYLWPTLTSVHDYWKNHNFD